jgi:hypothetical protein
MGQYCLPSVPTAAIYNNLETFYPFLSRFEDSSILEQRKFRGDRALFWLGSAKLVFCSANIPDAEEICRRYGYDKTRVLAPLNPSWQLSLDILQEPRLVSALVDYAGRDKIIQLIPYATTKEVYQLARHLRDQHGLTVLLPESPDEKNLWVRDYLDTKLGFRMQVTNWVTPAVDLPRGFAASDAKTALQLIRWFSDQGVDCILKPDKGESGLGMKVYQHGALPPDLYAQLQGSAEIKNELVVIEEFIPAKNGLSPSFEAFVPPLHQGEPYITYMSNQHFAKAGQFSGVLISKTYTQAGWYAPLVENGLRIAARLQAMGYVGYFDIDTIVDAQGKIHLLEINTRRTGGTYAHEFGVHTFGPDYQNEVTLLSMNRMDGGGITSLDELCHVLAPVLFPIHSEKRGIVITVTSDLKNGNFGCLVSGKDISDVNRLKQEAERLLRRYQAQLFLPVLAVGLRNEAFIPR